MGACELALFYMVCLGLHVERSTKNAVWFSHTAFFRGALRLYLYTYYVSPTGGRGKNLYKRNGQEKFPTNLISCSNHVRRGDHRSPAVPVLPSLSTPGTGTERIRRCVRSPLKIHKTGGAEKKHFVKNDKKRKKRLTNMQYGATMPTSTK